MKRLSVLGASVVLLLTATTALATPPSGVTAVELARGTSAAAYTITHEANRDTSTQTLTFAPGAATGWHTHPGPVVVIVQSGTLSLWDSVDCTRETYTAGQAVIVPGGSVFDLAQNEDAAVPLVLTVTYYNVPVGGPLTTPAPAAQCGMDVAAGGVTPVTHSRTRLATPLNISGAAGTDLLIQELTWAPGSTTGWHSHPGPVTVAVHSGNLTFQADDCSTTAYAAGTTLFDSGTTHQATSDQGALVFATYMNIPVGAAPRIDQAAPACTATPPPAAPTAAPTASALPNTSASAAIGPGGSLAGVASAVATAGFLALASMALVAVTRRRA